MSFSLALISDLFKEWFIYKKKVELNYPMNFAGICFPANCLHFFQMLTAL